MNNGELNEKKEEGCVDSVPTFGKSGDPTEADVAQLASRMRQTTDDAIRLMEQLLRNSAVLKSTQEIFSQRLGVESAKRERAEALAATSEQNARIYERQAIEFESKVTELTRTIVDKEAKLEQAMVDKRSSLEDLERELANQQALMRGLKYMRQNVDAFRIGESILAEPCGACMLPNGCVLVADTLEGLLLFSAHTELLKKVVDPDKWKWPQGLVYDGDLGVVHVSMLRKMGDGNWKRCIVTYNLELVEQRFIMGPDDGFIDDNVAKERVALSPTQELYMTLCDKIGSALYKCTGGHWSLLTKRQGASFVDCQVLAVIGPITDVLVTEARMGYVHKFAIRGNEIIDRKSMAIVEKPGALCVDDRGHLFIQDILSGKIRLVDTSRFEPLIDICIVDDSVFSITASHGYLGVAVRESKMVRIFRYARDPKCEKAVMNALNS